MATMTFRTSAIYAPGESRLPLLAGAGDARVQPICADDVAACVLAALDAAADDHRGYELAGPQELCWRRFAALATGGALPARPAARSCAPRCARTRRSPAPRRC